jgi:hypothetical protein
VQRPDVVIRAVEDLPYGGIGKQGRQGGKVGYRQGVDQDRLLRRRELQQADPFLVVVEGIRLQVEREQRFGADPLDQAPQSRGGNDDFRFVLDSFQNSLTIR